MKSLADEHHFEIRIAQTAAEVCDAWHVLYQCYENAEFIQPNPTEIYTFPQAPKPGTVVLLACEQGRPVTTMSLVMDRQEGVPDHQKGLPLDIVYQKELDELRTAGGKLMEVGLYGTISKASSSAHVFELTRYAYYYAIQNGIANGVCGIPPERVKLYESCMGFKHIGETKPYNKVRDHLVSLMQSNSEYLIDHIRDYRCGRYWDKNPLDGTVFENRFDFAPEHMEGTAIEQFLQLQMTDRVLDTDERPHHRTSRQAGRQPRTLHSQHKRSTWRSAESAAPDL